MRRRDFVRVAATGALGAVCLQARSAAQTPVSKNRTSSVALSTAALAKIEARLRQLLRETAVPGAALAIVQDGRLAWQRAFGVRDAASGAPVDAATVFEAASVSKTVFAYMALRLCERGTLGLDVPLARYAKARFFAGDPRLDEVTARHALAHSTGFPDWRGGDAALRCHTKPGERFLYSGEGYYYLQSTITGLLGRRLTEPCGRYEGDFEVCATDFDAFMRRALLDPLGMTASGYVWHERFVPVIARPHDQQGRPLAGKRPNAADIARYGAVGELRTTVADYAKFLSAILTLPPGDAFLGAAMRDEMVRPQIKLDPAAKIDGADSWALGWAVQERPTGNVIVHSGGQAGFRSLTMASVERRAGFVVFTNGDDGARICYDQTLGELLTPLLAG